MYEGFDKLVGQLQARGKSPEVARAIAATIGRAKYGTKRFNKAAAKGKRLG